VSDWKEKTTMNEELIGKAAGVVWHYLNEASDGVTLGALKKARGIRADEAVAAIGWLAREGKLVFEDDPRRKATVIRLVGSAVGV
jgi:hypothetical protein